MARMNKRNKARFAARTIFRLPHVVSGVSAAALAAGGQPVWSQITPDTTIGADILANGSHYSITAGKVVGDVGFNGFSRFDVLQNYTVDFQQGSLSSLVNIVTGGGASQIAGTVNILRAAGNEGASTYFLNSDGFAVHATGVINAGALILSTPDEDFIEDLVKDVQAATTSMSGYASYAKLISGEETLSSNGEIKILGQINASRLTMRAGQRMIIDQRLSTGDETSAASGRGINVTGLETASGVSVENGVIRLFAGSGGISMQGAKVSATGGVVAQVKDGASITADDTTIDTRRNGATPEAAVHAGSVLLSAKDITLVDTTIHASAQNSGLAGNVIVVGQNISLTRTEIDAVSANGVDQDGMVALLARNELEHEINFNIDVPKARVSITLDHAEIDAGAVVISAYAEAGNILGDPDETVEAAQIDAAGANFDQMGNYLEEVAKQTFQVVENTLVGQTTNLFGMLPVQVQVVQAKAEIRITDSSLTATGEWAGTQSDGLILPLSLQGLNGAPPPLLNDTDVQHSNNGLIVSFLTSTDITLAQNLFGFRQADGSNLSVALPRGFDAAKDSLYIHAHAETDIQIAPMAIGLGVAVAVTDTTSKVQITNSDLTTLSGNVNIYSTAQENLNVTLAASKIAGVSDAVIVAVHDLTNQLVVSGGSIHAAGNLDVGAYTGKNHNLSAASNGGKDAKEMLSVIISLGNNHTEAALGGSINLSNSGDLTLEAETLYYNKTHLASATGGLTDPMKVMQKKLLAAQTTNEFLVSQLTSKFGGPMKQNTAVFGVAVDVTLETDDTFATLGGHYHDLSDGKKLVDLGSTSVDASGDVEVNSTLRFASEDEGGLGLSRGASASLGKITALVKNQLAAQNAILRAAGQPEITEADLISQFGHVAMFSVGVNLMDGTTRAEIGDVTLSANSLDVAAKTAYPKRNPLLEIADTWTDFANEVADYSPIEQAQGTALTPTLPDVMLFLPHSYMTSSIDVKAKSPKPSDPKEEVVTVTMEQAAAEKAADQSLAVGLGVNYFSTDNTTTAVIRNGAIITLPSAAAVADDKTGTLSVTASQSAGFYHGSNLPTTSLLADHIDDNLGASLNAARSVSDVLAEIESGVKITARKVDVDARTSVTQLMFVVSGGGGTELAINGAIGLNMVEASTQARIGSAAILDASGDVKIKATDDSVTWGTAGAVNQTQGTGVGAAAHVNFITRNVRAGVWEHSTTQTGGRFDVGSMSIVATNDALDVASAVAGVKYSPPKGQPWTDDDAEISVNPLYDPGVFVKDEQHRLLLQMMAITSADGGDTKTDGSDVGKPGQVKLPSAPDAGGKQQSAGWAVSGAVALNLSLGNTTVAELSSDATVTLTDGDLTVKAVNDMKAIAVGGAISAALNSGQSSGEEVDANALAGGFAVYVDTRDVIARIQGATIKNDGGKVLLSAEDESVVINVAVGGAGTSKGDMAVAGSVAIAVLTGGVSAEAKNTTISSASEIDLSSKDSSLTLSVGGGVGVNLDKSGGVGAGAGIAVNIITRGAETKLSGITKFAGNSVSLRSVAEAMVFGFGISAGVGDKGLAGSVSVNLINNGAAVNLVGTNTSKLSITASDLTVSAEEDNEIYSLAGAVAKGGKAAVGGAVAVNVITSATGVSLEHTDLVLNNSGDVLLSTITESSIYSLGVAGGAATGGANNSQGVGVGVGISANTISVTSNVIFTDGTVNGARRFEAKALGERSIWSGGGGVGIGGKGAAGFAATINLLLANDTIVDLSRSTVNASGDIVATATADGEIYTGAVAVSASSNASIGGAATVNVSTSATKIIVSGAALKSGQMVSLKATDTLDVISVSGAAALSKGGAGVGGAVSANFVYHTTSVTGEASTLEAQTAINVQAENIANLTAVAVGLAAAGTTAVAGSVAVGDIGNTTEVSLTKASLKSGTDITLSANQDSDIFILSGAAAATQGGGSAVGGAITVAMIHDTVRVNLTTSGDISAQSLSALATKTSLIDALAATGAVAPSGAAAVAGSIVYTQIGKPGSTRPTVGAVETAEGGEDPAAAGENEALAAKNSALGRVNGAGLGASHQFSALSDDITLARVEIGAGNTLTLPSMTVRATEDAHTRSLAGGVAVSGTAGVGAGIAVNLLFGKTEAELVLPTSAQNGGAVTVAALQKGSVSALGAGIAVAGKAAIGGSVLVNVMDRAVTARIIGQGETFKTNGEAVSVTADQIGKIDALAGGVAAGGTAGIGAAVVVNVVSDDVEAEILNARVDQRSTGQILLAGAGSSTLRATQDLEIKAISVAGAAAGVAAVSGSFVVNVANGDVITRIKNATLYSGDVEVLALAQNALNAWGGAISVAGSAAVGVGVVSNVSQSNILTDIDGARITSAGSIKASAQAVTELGALAVAGGIAGTVAVTGSGIGNLAQNKVATKVHRSFGDVDELGGSDLVAHGSVALVSEAITTIALSGGTNEERDSDSQTDTDNGESINISLSGGGVAGVGLSATVNQTKNDVTTAVLDQSRVLGLGHQAISAGRQNDVRGVIIDAYAYSNVDSITATGAVGGVAGVAGVMTLALLADSAKTQIGGSLANQGAMINGVLDEDQYGDYFASLDANGAQDAVITALAKTQSDAWTVSLAGGVIAGVGAGSSTTLMNSRALVEITNSNIAADRDITLTAKTEADLKSFVMGAAGGIAGVSGSVNVNTMSGAANVVLKGASLSAGEATIAGQGHLTINAENKAKARTYVGGIAGGIAGVAGAVAVNVFSGEAGVSTEKGDANTVLSANGNVTIAATNRIDAAGVAASTAAGVVGVSISTQVNLVKAATTVQLGAHTEVVSGKNLSIAAREYASIGGKTGSLGAGAVGVGNAIDIAQFSSTVGVAGGENLRLQARGGSVEIEASAERELSSKVAVGAAGAVAVVSAVSVLNLGGSAGEEGRYEDRMHEIDAELARDVSSDKKGDAANLASMAGAGDTFSTVAASRKSTGFGDAVSPDTVEVSLADGTVITAGEDVTLTAQSRNTAVQEGGSAGAGFFAGVASGVLVSHVNSQAAIELGHNTQIMAGGDITLAALTGGVMKNGTEQAVIDASAFTAAASVGVSAGVGVAVAKLSGSAKVLFGDDVYLGGDNGNYADAIDVSTKRTDVVKADVVNISSSALGGAGVAVSDVRLSGSSEIYLGGEGARLRGLDVDIALLDLTQAISRAASSTGGILAGAANSAVATARNDASMRLTMGRAEIDGQTVDIEGRSAARAQANVVGNSAGFYAVGTSLADAKTNVGLHINLSDVEIAADTVTLRGILNAANGINAEADASAAAGGLVSGNGAVSLASADYSVSANISGNIIARDSVSLGLSSANYGADAYATGKSGGLVAVGLVLSQAEQDGEMSLNYGEGAIVANTVRLNVANAPSLNAEAVSGSGGLVSGSGSDVRITGNNRTALRLGETDALDIIASNLFLNAGHAVTLGASIDNTSAAAVGVSGATSETDYTTAVDTYLGGHTRISAGNIDISATNAVSRPQDGFNVSSGSGGALDIAAIVSKTIVKADTNVTLADTILRNAQNNANLSDDRMIVQTGSIDDPGMFRIGAYANMALTDRIKLDAGGAIAIPIGESHIKIERNNTNVVVNHARLLGLGTLKLYSGADADLMAHADTSTYGLAGAGTAKTYATFNSAQNISLASGSLVESLGNVELMAGYKANGAQSIKLRADSRVYNKTAFPIVTNPQADATANTVSKVSIAEGARILAVRDVTLFADGGSRDVLGYGRGKDLYREVLNQIGSFFSNLVGGGDVSLDIETGKSVDNAENGLIVNGYVRAGSRNQQVLILDENNQLANSANGFSDSLAEDITWWIEENVSISDTVQARIDLLESYVKDPILSRDAGAKAAWLAEIAELTARAIATSDTATIIHLGDILAATGNINLKADYITGSETGTLEAPGDALIKVATHSGDFLETGAMYIPDTSGGKIIFNDVAASSIEELRVLSTDKTVRPMAFDMIATGNSKTSLIEVSTTVPPAPSVGTPQGGTIIIAGDLTNINGDIRVVSNYGDVEVQAALTAVNVYVDIPNGNYIQSYKPGVSNSGGSPEAQYKKYFESVQASFREALIGRKTGNTEGATFTVSTQSGAQWVGSGSGSLPTLQRFTLAPTESAIRAGKNVFISADVLNINGLIQAGRGSYVVDIKAGIDAEIAALGKGSGLHLLYDPSEPASASIPKSANILSDVRVYYNFDTGRIEVDPLMVQGGRVELTGNIISTGSGKIEALDGYGSISVKSAAATDVLLKRMDTGPQLGVEGVVRITDTGRRNGFNDALTTEYRRSGSQVQVFTNTAAANEQGARETIMHFAQVGAGGDRSATYNPIANRDLIILQGETTTYTAEMIEKELIVVGITGSKSKKKIVETLSTRVNNVSTYGGPYIGQSLAGEDYEYMVTGELVSKSETATDRTKTHDSVRWYKFGSGWRHHEWQETTTSTQLYEHRLKADYGINIVFSGADTGSLSVITQGNVILADTVNNYTGAANITSLGGNIQTSDNRVLVSSSGLNLSAAQGSILGIGGEFRIDMQGAGTLNAVASNQISLREMNGDLRIGTISTSARTGANSHAELGQVSLRAEGSIVTAGNTALITANGLSLAAETGAIGASAAPLRINLEGGVLNARAYRDVALEETTGDMLVHQVRSDTGSVKLVAHDGSIVDSNLKETRDARTEAELMAHWEDGLGLFGAGLSDRAAQARAAMEAERLRSYQTYWAKRSASGAAVTFTVEAAVVDSLRANGWTEAQLDAWMSGQEALYAEWNANAGLTADFVPQLSAEEVAANLRGQEWTANELTRSIREGLIRDVSDTVVRVEDPNVMAAGDITLIARDHVGSLLPDYVISERAGDLTADDLRKLSQATRNDLTINAETGEIRIRQSDDFNFAFTNIDPLTGQSVGKLRVQTQTADIFLGSEEAAQVADLTSARDVDLRIDGLMTDAHEGTRAVHGRIITLESGVGSIGTDNAPVRVEVSAGGELTARSGGDVNISAPLGNLPIGAINAAGHLKLYALGAMTDAVGSDLPRLLANSVSLNAASIGASGANLGVQIRTPSTGTLDYTARTGGAYLTGYSDVRLSFGSMQTSGAFDARGALTLLGNNTLSFGQTSQLNLSLAQGMNVAQSTGVDISGGTLSFNTSGGVGTQTRALHTAVATLSFSVSGQASNDIYIREADALRLENGVQNTATGMHTQISAGGNLSIGTLNGAASDVYLTANRILDGRIIGDDVTLLAALDLGATSRLDVTASTFAATAQNGTATLGLRDRATVINHVTVGGAGALDLRAVSAPLTLQQGMTTQGGNIRLQTDGDFVQAAGSTVNASAGTIAATIGGDLALAQFVTSNATANALALTVAGDVRRSDIGLALDARFGHAQLSFGSLAPIGPSGLEVAFASLAGEVAQGDAHLNELDDLTLMNFVARDGSLDLYAGGSLDVTRAEALGNAADLNLAAGANLTSDSATLTGQTVRLSAFGGNISGKTGATFAGNISAGSTGHLFAQGGINYRETSGGLNLGYALAQTGDLNITAPDEVRIGILGAGGNLTLAAEGKLRVNLIGGGTLDLADELAFALVKPELYGSVLASSPRNVTLTANGPESSIYGGFVGAGDSLTLRADHIDVKATDATPENGLRMQITDDEGSIAEVVKVDVLATGAPIAMADYFADPRLLLAGREIGDGVVTLVSSQIGTGHIYTAGTQFIGQDILSTGDVRFIQRDVSVLAQVSFDQVSVTDTVHVLALPDQTYGFDIRGDIALDVFELYKLNDNWGDVELDGGQGYVWQTATSTVAMLNSSLHFSPVGAWSVSMNGVYVQPLSYGFTFDKDGREVVRLPLLRRRMAALN